MNAEITYTTLLRWLNSCDTVAQAEVVKTCAKSFLIERYDAVDLYTTLVVAVMFHQHLIMVRLLIKK